MKIFFSLYNISIHIFMMMFMIALYDKMNVNDF